jgi:homocitrate synthase
MISANKLTRWNAIKYRATQLDLEMSDTHYKKCAAKIKQIADVKAITIDDTDRII